MVPDELRGRPFTSAEARRHGVTPAALQGKSWRQVLRDVWVHSSAEDDLGARIAAARLVLGEEGFLCGLTAAWTHGVDVQDRRGNLVWMGRPTGKWRRTRAGCLLREITVESSDLDLVEGTLVTTPLRTAFDCARWLSLTEAVVVADAFAAAGLMTKAAFCAYTKSHRGLRGVRQADMVADLVEPLTESAMESRLRVLLITSGFPRPVPQHVVKDHAGRFVARLDFAYPDRRIAIEYDGSLHWEQRRDDDRRRDNVRALDWTVLVASRSDYYEEPHAFLAQARRAFAAKAA
jgi:very-short-patch-repair endonuclease